MRVDGKTGHRIPKGKKYSGDEVEFGAKVHYRLKRRHRPERFESRRLKKIFFGNMLLKEEAIFGTKNAFRNFGTIRRLRVHRRWDTKKGWKVFEDNLGTRSSSKRFEDQVAVGGGKWQGHGGDDAE